MNLFRGRVEQGKIKLGGTELSADGSRDRHALIYVRPHELEIHREAPADALFQGVVVHANAAGAVARVEVKRDGGEIVEVQLSHEQLKAIGLRAGDAVFVSARNSAVFADDYSI